MASRTVFDYATPFAIMVGRWSGMTTTFDARGGYLGSIASLVTIYWKNPRTLHYEQDELPDLDARLGDNPHRTAIARSCGIASISISKASPARPRTPRKRSASSAPRPARNLSFPPRVSRGSLLQQPVLHEPERTPDHRSVRSHGPAAGKHARPAVWRGHVHRRADLHSHFL